MNVQVQLRASRMIARRRYQLLEASGSPVSTDSFRSASGLYSGPGPDGLAVGASPYRLDGLRSRSSDVGSATFGVTEAGAGGRHGNSGSRSDRDCRRNDVCVRIGGLSGDAKLFETRGASMSKSSSAEDKSMRATADIERREPTTSNGIPVDLSPRRFGDLLLVPWIRSGADLAAGAPIVALA